jgi:hypothetical protein
MKKKESKNRNSVFHQICAIVIMADLQILFPRNLSATSEINKLDIFPHIFGSVTCEQKIN